jgi:hypothetical protein
MAQLNSALFIDYDNVRTELERYDPTTAARFSNKTLMWLDALEKQLALPDGRESETRRIVSRRCYASPHMINSYRRNFTQTGFEVVDCPPLTTHLKNSADIYIVMDIVDYLQRYPHIDEYIILSADADFVPVLNRLRKELKKSVIFTSYNTTAAYRNCADRTIEADFFSTYLSIESVAPRAAQEMARGETTVDAVIAVPSDPAEPAAGDLPGAQQAPEEPEQPLDGHSPDEIEQCLVRAAERRLGLLPLAAAAQVLRAEMPALFASGWAGHRNFRAFLEALPLTRLELDERSQELSLPDFLVPLPGWPEEDRAELADFVTDIVLSAKKPVPLFAPREYSLILHEIAAYFQGEAPETLTECAAAVAQACERQGVKATESEIRFVAIGISMQQYRFDEARDAAHLAALWRVQVFYLCGEPEWMREPEEAALLARWLHAEEESIEAARDDFLRRTGEEPLPEQPAPAA